MVDKFLSEDLLRALDTFISEQHPGLSRYDGLRMAFHDWAVEHGYLDTRPDEVEAFPQSAQDVVPREDRHKAGGMLDQFILDQRPDGRETN